MKLRGWPALVAVGFIVVAGALMLQHLRRLQSGPQPSTVALKQLVAEVGATFPGASVAAPTVVEKAFFVNVRAVASGISGTPSLAAASRLLNSRGFVTSRMDDHRSATLCKGETAAELRAYSAEGAVGGIVLISLTWGTGSAVCQ